MVHSNADEERLAALVLVHGDMAGDRDPQHHS